MPSKLSAARLRWTERKAPQTHPGAPGGLRLIGAEALVASRGPWSGAQAARTIFAGPVLTTASVAPLSGST